MPPRQSSTGPYDPDELVRWAERAQALWAALERINDHLRDPQTNEHGKIVRAQVVIAGTRDIEAPDA